VLGLGANRSLAGVAGSASTRIRAGENLMMTNGLPMYEGAAEVLTGMPQTVNLALVDQGVTAVFPGPALTVAQKLRGAVKVHLSLTPSSSGAGSVFAYLLDEGPDGTTSMVGHVPYSWANGKAGQALTVDTVIPYQGYDLPAGHKLVAAVSTGDVLYQSRNPMLSTLSIGASSYFDVPVDKG
jgi:predicted acyl esterase